MPFTKMVIEIITMLTILKTGMAISRAYEIHVPGFYRFLHENVASKDLLCPDCCGEDSKNPCPTIFSDFSSDRSTICCIEKAMPYWKFDKYYHLRAYYDLFVRYNNTTQRHVIYDKYLYIYGYSRNLSFYDLAYQDKQLTYFPDNICDFPKLVWLNFSQNNLDKITDLSCLQILDTLDLSFNKIRVIHSSAFSTLPLMRYLYLSNNHISTLEPGTFKYRPGSLKYVDFRMNHIVSLDVTNVVLGYFFFLLDFSYNRISTFTNYLHWDGFKASESIGGGWVHLHYNNFTRMIDFSRIGFKNIHSIFRVSFNYHVVLKHNPWLCDCHSFPYFNVFVQANMHFSVVGFDCESPPSLKGHSVQEFRQDKTLLHRLICNITMKEKCPPKCYCFNQPSQSRIVMNCSSTQRHNMPKVVPELNNLDIDLSNNMIESFESHNYLYRTIRIDLSFNRITFIDPTVYSIKSLGFISLHNNPITVLDRSVQMMSPCKLFFGNLTLLKCSCERLWIKIWLERQKVAKCSRFRNFMTCKRRDKMIDLSGIPDQLLCPVVEKTNLVYAWLPVSLIFTIGIIMLYYNFQYEVFLIFRSLRFKLQPNNNERKIIYDVYMSFNTENDDVRIWTIQVLNKYLEKQEYKICLPPRDFSVGGIQADQIHHYISNSRSFVVVVSEDYFELQSQCIEWNHIWNIYKTEPKSNLVIINFDILKSNQIHDRKLKACIRLGYSHDFSNLNNKMLSDINRDLGNTKKQSKNMEYLYVFKTETVL